MRIELSNAGVVRLAVVVAAVVITLFAMSTMFLRTASGAPTAQDFPEVLAAIAALDSANATRTASLAAQISHLEGEVRNLDARVNALFNYDPDRDLDGDGAKVHGLRDLRNQIQTMIDETHSADNGVVEITVCGDIGAEVGLAYTPGFEFAIGGEGHLGVDAEGNGATGYLFAELAPLAFDGWLGGDLGISAQACVGGVALNLSDEPQRPGGIHTLHSLNVSNTNSTQLPGSDAEFSANLALNLLSGMEELGIGESNLDAALELPQTLELEPSPSALLDTIDTLLTALPIPPKVKTIVEDFPSMVPSTISDAKPDCNGDFGPLNDLIGSACAEPPLLTIEDAVEQIRGSVSEAQKAVETKVTETVEKAKDILDQEITNAESNINRNTNLKTGQLSMDFQNLEIAVNHQNNDLSIFQTQHTGMHGMITNLTSKVDDIKGDFPEGQSYASHTWGNLENRARELQSSIGGVKSVADTIDRQLDTVESHADKARDNSLSVRQTVGDNRGEILDISKKLDNVRHVLGTERPVDATGNDNGAQPITYWAYSGWANLVGPRAEQLSDISSRTENIQHVLGTERINGETLSYWNWNAWDNGVKSLEGVRFTTSFLNNEMGESPGRPEGRNYGEFLRHSDAKIDKIRQHFSIGFDGSSGGGLPDLPDFPG